MKENKELMNNVMQYLDLLSTTINPGFDAFVPNLHPCQKRSEDLRDDKQDYIKLVNKLQRHTWCNSSYCLRVDNHTGQQKCRFGYPKDLTENTYLHDDNRQPKLITVRNNLYINPHDRLQLQG